jgi:hypothetical protein
MTTKVNHYFKRYQGSRVIGTIHNELLSISGLIGPAQPNRPGMGVITSSVVTTLPLWTYFQCNECFRSRAEPLVGLRYALFSGPGSGLAGDNTGRIDRPTQRTVAITDANASW